MAKSKFKILIVGFGTVGKGFFDLFYEKRDLLKLENAKQRKRQFRTLSVF